MQTVNAEKVKKSRENDINPLGSELNSNRSLRAPNSNPRIRHTKSVCQNGGKKENSRPIDKIAK